MPSQDALRTVSIDYSEAGLAVVTINSPPVNALSEEVIADLSTAFTVLEHAKGVRVVILTGHGSRAFVAGADLNVLSRKNPDSLSSFLTAIHNTFNRIEVFPKPVICAINSHTIGNGCELAMVCDIRIASEEATFLFPECRLGVVSAGGATQRLPRLIPLGRALYYFFTAAKISAREALEVGLIDFVVPAAELLPTARQMARAIAANAPQTISVIKKLIKGGLSMPINEALEMELEHCIAMFRTEEPIEGITAYLEKRIPVFRQR